MKKLFNSGKASMSTKAALAALAVGALSVGTAVANPMNASIQTTINGFLTTIKTALEAIYGGMLAVVTVIAVVICGWCFMVKMFSKNPRSIDEASQWMKRVCIAWLGFMLLSVFVKIGLDIVTDSGANTATPWS